jgi:biopolymer transport protein ExbD
MSHGGESKAEPNLVSLLDLVLQLIMFFMVCVNFVVEQVDGSIKLPHAIIAKPTDKLPSNILFVNINSKGQVQIPAGEKATDSSGRPLGGQTLSNVFEIEYYFRKKFEAESANRGEADAKKLLIIIRGDREVTFQPIYQVMNACKQAKFERVALRALIGAEGK